MSEFTHLLDLASARLGGEAVATNDDFFAEKENLVKAEAPVFIPGKYTDRGKWMDGWESRRRRTPGHDWCIVKLGLPGVIHAFVVDTAFFTGNYPSHCSVDACGLPREQVLFAAFAGWDAAGAGRFGYPTYWVNRAQAPPEALGAPPDGVGTSLDGLLAFVAARAPARHT